MCLSDEECRRQHDPSVPDARGGLGRSFQRGPAPSPWLVLRAWPPLTVGGSRHLKRISCVRLGVAIAISSDGTVVNYQPVIETQTADGATNTERKPGRLEPHEQGEMTQVHRFWMPLDDQMMSYGARLVSCGNC